jgi:hypothetical protein
MIVLIIIYIKIAVVSRFNFSPRHKEAKLQVKHSAFAVFASLREIIFQTDTVPK